MGFVTGFLSVESATPADSTTAAVLFNSEEAGLKGEGPAVALRAPSQGLRGDPPDEAMAKLWKAARQGDRSFCR